MENQLSKQDMENIKLYLEENISVINSVNYLYDVKTFSAELKPNIHKTKLYSELPSWIDIGTVSTENNKAYLTVNKKWKKFAFQLRK